MKSFRIGNLLYVFAALAISLSLLIFMGENNSALVTASSAHDHSQMAMAGMSMDDMAMPGMDMANMPAGQSGLNSKSSTSQAVAASGPTVQVGQGGLNFEPKVITITARQSVTWNWASDVHSVTSDTPSLFDSGVNNAPHTFSFEFDTPGTYNYYCKIHGGAGLVGMAGTVVVLPPPTITSLTPNTDQQNSPSFTLEVNGSNFANDAVVNWNGAARPTTFLNSTTLLATITGPGDLGIVGDTGVTVLNSADMTTSDPMTFTVTAGCTRIVVNKKTDTNTCGDFRFAVATSPPVTVTFALLVSDQIDLTTGPVTLASGVTLRAPCSSGPTITLRSTSAANNFVLNGGVSVRGLFFSRVGGGGGNLSVVQALTQNQNGPNHFSCSKVSQT